MALSIRTANSEDTKEIGALFEQWGMPCKTMEFASETGFAVCNDNGIQGAAYLYKTNSPVSIIDMFVINKDLPKEEKETAIDLLIAALVVNSKKMGYRVIMAEPRFAKSIDRLKKHGFTEMKPGTFWMEF